MVTLGIHFFGGYLFFQEEQFCCHVFEEGIFEEWYSPLYDIYIQVLQRTAKTENSTVFFK